MVAHWSMGILPNPVSSVVAPAYFRRDIRFIGLVTDPEKRRFKVAHRSKSLTPAPPAYSEVLCIISS
jgi:hypothetical protein